jgi:uncharacterized integral membrane protein
MLSLIATILFGLATTYIALQNSSNITLKLGYYTFTNIPVYVVIVLSILVGILITALIHSLNRLSITLTLRSKDKIITDHQTTISQLKQEIHELEIENAQLRRIDEDSDEEEQEQEYIPTYPTRIAPSIR